MRKSIKSVLSLFVAIILVLSIIPLSTIHAKADGIDDFIGRCYKVTLGRDADSDGYSYWRDILVNRKQDGSVVAHGFLFSPEYIDKNTTPEQYVKDLYMLFMGREPEQSGYDYWCEKMANGESREQIFAGFANSKEYFDLCNGYGITAGYYSADYGIQQVNGVNLFVERMYQTSLDRLGDQGGQNDWVQALLEGRISGIECARCFVQSPEFINKGLSDEAYLKSLYKAFMGREYDQGGLDYWLENIKKGYTRDEVFAGFAMSPEFEGICNFYGIIRGEYTPTDIGIKKDPNTNEDPGNSDNPIVSLSDAKVGDIVKFGKYEQDGNLDNGEEDIEWEVLEVKDGKALVISKYALDNVPYNMEYEEVTWETSWLRNWLNNDFYNTAFSDEEKNIIPSVMIENEDYFGRTYYNGNNTTDKVFCLSVKELEKYFGDYNYYDDVNQVGLNQKLICVPTQYTINHGVTYEEITSDIYNNDNYVLKDVYSSDVVGLKGCFWWARYPGSNYDKSNFVSYWGRTGIGEIEYVSAWNAVRPAIYIKLSNNANEDKPKYEVGQIIKFGQYEQDGNFDNGKEDIEWEVLEVKDGKALVISKMGLEAKPYNEEQTEVTWENCSLRNWLNNDFYNKAFSDEDKKMIPAVMLDNNDNLYFGTFGGNKTKDKLFCLSVEEVEKYFGGYKYLNDMEMWGSNSNTACTPTLLAINNGADYYEYTAEDYEYNREKYKEREDDFDLIGKRMCSWWLRSSGLNECACVVEHSFYGTGYSHGVSYSKNVVRPAMYIEY